MPVKSEERYPDKIVIGTRGSPLALWQAETVKSKIDSIGQNIDVSIKIIRTSGDWRPEQGEAPLDPSCGGKACFAKEIEDALLRGDIDIAVHSMKDIEVDLPEGLCIPFMLPRGDFRDAFLSNNTQKYKDLPTGSVVGTVSVRRAAFLLHQRPDLKIVPLRGNVETRIAKVRAGQVDATLLACAGLERLGLLHEISSVVALDEMLPAVGQGAIGIEMRGQDKKKLSFIDQFNCLETQLCVTCERGVLRALGGSCHTPVGVLAQLIDGQMRLSVRVVALDGSQIWSKEECAEVENEEQARHFGEGMGKSLKSIVPAEVLG